MRGRLISLLLWLVAVARGAEPGADDADDESDSAPFTVVVEHGAGGDWRCAAALLSLRTALTSARCARGPPSPADDVWARATQPAAVPAATRVLRIALHQNSAVDGAEPGGSTPRWAADTAANDVALLELAEALGGARPILLAAVRADCVPPRRCYVVRALGGGADGVTRLRIVELELRAPAACWPRAAAHPADERALCLAGPPLCRSELGAGVVCGGKLCGVLSASLGAADGPSACGAPHAAGGAPRWRRFLHCAHTRGACGRDGPCAPLCTERLLDESARVAPPAQALEVEGDEPAQVLRTVPPHRSVPESQVIISKLAENPPKLWEEPPSWEPPTRTTVRSPTPTAGAEVDETPVAARRAPPVAPQAAAPASSPAPVVYIPTMAGQNNPQGRHAFEFEPNRQDFMMRPSSVPTRVVLKAGEYDNAADYMGAAEEPAPAPGGVRPALATPPPPPVVPRTTLPAPPPAAPPLVAPQTEHVAPAQLVSDKPARKAAAPHFNPHQLLTSVAVFILTQFRWLY